MYSKKRGIGLKRHLWHIQTFKYTRHSTQSPEMIGVKGKTTFKVSDSRPHQIRQEISLCTPVPPFCKPWRMICHSRKMFDCRWDIICLECILSTLEQQIKTRRARPRPDLRQPLFNLRRLDLISKRQTLQQHGVFRTMTDRRGTKKYYCQYYGRRGSIIER